MVSFIADWIAYSLLNLQGRLADSVHFFIDDIIKIFIMIFVIVSVIGYLRSYLPAKKVKEWLSKKNKIAGHFAASIFGILTPFCSCSSIPLYMGFLKAGVPLGVSLSFLITSPLVNEYIVVIMWVALGWKITVAYILTGVLIGVVGGLIIGNMKLENHLESEFRNGNNAKEENISGFKVRAKYGLDEAKKVIKMVWLYLIIGIGIGAVFHGYVPAEFMQSVVEKAGIFAVPIAVAVGVPLYANCAAIIPVAVVFIEKGVPLGTALAFMMSSAALSLPEAVILRKVMKFKLLAVFFGITAASIVVIGYLFNVLYVFFI